MVLTSAASRPQQEAGPVLPARPRILVPRACRTPQFADAVRRLRSLYPDAELTALAPAAMEAETMAAGADSVVPFRGARFGLIHAGARLLAALRRRRFDAVAIPQMSDDFAGYANVYRMAAAIGTPAVILVPFDRPLHWYGSRALVRFVLLESIRGLARRWDVPLFLALLMAAAVRGIWDRGRRRRRPRRPGRQRVLHIITTLGVGGAQVQLAELVDRTPPDEYETEILVLGRGDGTFSAQRLARRDVPIDYVDTWPALTPSLIAIVEHCRRGHYDVVHTWLFYANVVGAAAARLAGIPFIVSGVRNLSLWKRQWSAKWWYRTADTLAARVPDVLTVNATALAPDHRWWARTRRAIEIVPNGLSPARVLEHTADARRELRASLGLDQGATVVGTIGRLAPEKDQAVFLRAIARARSHRPDIHGVVVGDGECGAALKSLATALGLGPDAVTFMGRRSDSRRIMAGLDLFVLTSQSEGFPNVLLEAAFLGIPAISTAVAGAIDLLEAGDLLFPIGDAATAAARIVKQLEGLPTAIGRASAVRTRAYRLFTADRMAARWLALYRTGEADS